MRLSTIFMLLLAVLLTVVVMQNAGEVKVTILFAEIYISKLVLFSIFILAGFILGYMARRPRKLGRVEDFDRHEDTDAPTRGQRLSDEDRDYIS